MTKNEVLNKLLRYTIKDSITGCWLHVGTRVKGHGKIRVGKRMYYVHRLSAWIYYDFNLNDYNTQVNHKQECKNKHCWNPEHIYIGTQSENIRDIMSSGNHHFASRTQCKLGHPLNGIVHRSDGHTRRYCKICDSRRKKRVAISSV